MSNLKKKSRNFVSLNSLSKQEWLELRKKGIGSTDAPAVVGVSPWKTPLDVYLEKTDPNPPVDNSDLERFYIALHLEETIARMWGERNNFPVRADNKIRFHPDYKFIFANIDFLTRFDSTAILEVKNVSQSAFNKWEGVPDYYYIQVQHQMMVTGHKYAVLVCLVGGNQLHHFYIDADKELHKQLLSEEIKFWKEYVEKKVEPPPTINDVSKFRATPEKEAVATDDIWQVYLEACELKDQINKLKTRLDEINKRIQFYMRDAEILSYAGKPIVTWKQYIQRRLDTNAIKKDYPDIYDKYVKIIETRRFNLK